MKKQIPVTCRSQCSLAMAKKTFVASHQIDIRESFPRHTQHVRVKLRNKEKSRKEKLEIV